MQEVKNQDGSTTIPDVDELDNLKKGRTAQSLYRLSASIIVRDERRFFNTKAYLAANPSRMLSWCFTEDMYWLPEFLLTPKSLEEIEEMHSCMAASGKIVNPAKVTDLLRSFQQMGLIETTDADAGEAPSICRPNFKSESRYTPASAPISISIELPMQTALLSKLFQECNDMGVLGLDFHGGSDVLHALSASITEKDLSLGRAASSIRLKLDDITQDTFFDLCNVMRIWKRPPFIILECSGIPDRLQETQLQCFPFCVTYKVQKSDDEQTLKRIADVSLSGGAKFVLFNVDDTLASTENASALEIAAERLETLQSIQLSHPPLKVQVRFSGLPLPRDIVAPELTVKQIQGQMLGGCSSGLFLGNAHLTACDHIASPDELAAVGLLLPPNCCQSGMTYMAIDKSGTVYPCEEAIGMPDMIIGSITKTSLHDIWDSDKWAFFRGGWDLCDLKGCYRCKSYIGCSTRRCRIRAARVTGDILSPMSACLKSRDDLGIQVLPGKESK